MLICEGRVQNVRLQISRRSFETPADSQASSTKASISFAKERPYENATTTSVFIRK